MSGVAAAGNKTQGQQAVPPGQTRFIMVLRQPGARRDSPKVVTVPDVAKLGGNVESRRDNVLVITLPLAAAKHLKRSDRELRRGGKSDYFSDYQGIELYGLQLGLVGLGRIGRRVAKIALALLEG